AGAGPNLDASTRPAVWDVKGTKIGLVAFTDNQPEWEAETNCPGVFYLPIDADDERARRLLQTVREAKRAVDILVVSAHWGPNWGYKSAGGSSPARRCAGAFPCGKTCPIRPIDRRE